MSTSRVLPPSPLPALVARVREIDLPALVTAHRGDSQNAPENTLAAFELAIQAGSHLIELDVRQAACGTVMVIHDERVDRTTDGHGEVLRLRREELQELSAGSWFGPEYARERVPTIDEMLDLCRGRTVPMLEIKDKRRRSPELGARVVEALARHGMTEQAIVICREVERVAEVQAACRGTPISYLTFTKRQAKGATRLEGVSGVTPYWKSLSLRLVQQVRLAGAWLTPWTVDRASDMERLLELGCETLITNAPVTLADQIEGFEFARSEELHARYLRGEATDVDLETDAGAEGEAPDEVSRLQATTSDAGLGAGEDR